jgi:hypothetical protein
MSTPSASRDVTTDHLTAVEERRLRRLMEEDPPRTPNYGVFVLRADGLAGGKLDFLSAWVLC